MSNGTFPPFTIDGHEFDLATVPQVGLLAKRQIGHIMRIEATSRVRAQLIADAREAKRTKSGDPKVQLTNDERKAIKFDIKDPNHKAAYSAAQSALAIVIRSGKIGESTAVGAPRKSEFERRATAMCRKMVISSVQNKLKLWIGEKKLPKADQVFTYKVKGEMIERTFGEMVDSYYKVNRAAVDKAVQKQLEDERGVTDRAAKSEGEGLDF
jgi:hypothetical protein